jgi:hypothetical protein
VIGAWSTAEAALETTPSSGRRSPGRTRTRAPTATSSAGPRPSRARAVPLEHARGVGPQLHQRGHRPAGRAHRTLLERPREAEQEQQDGAVARLADGGGRQRREHHQQVDLQPPAAQGPHRVDAGGPAAREVGDGSTRPRPALPAPAHAERMPPTRPTSVSDVHAMLQRSAWRSSASSACSSRASMVQATPCVGDARPPCRAAPRRGRDGIRAAGPRPAVASGPCDDARVIDDPMALVELLHAGPTRLVYEFAGAGVSALALLHAVGGSSRTLLEATDRYAELSLAEGVGGAPVDGRRRRRRGGAGGACSRRPATSPAATRASPASA